jgi:predicted nuclease of predicted toxin-antitoxin system
MGTLFSELGPLADESTVGPRVYADANVPAGLVTFMRVSLGWDVFFVMEHDDLRRAPDIEHYRLARRLRRTLITMDRDYLDDRVFPPLETSGVLVLSAPNQRGLERLLTRADRDIFRVGAGGLVALPLEGTKLQVFPEFGAGLA